MSVGLGWFIALLGCVVASTWVRRWFTIQSGEAAFSDLLPYEFVTEDGGAVVLRNGALMGLLEMQPPNGAVMEDSELAHHRTAVEKALAELADGCCFHFEVQRAPSRGGWSEERDPRWPRVLRWTSEERRQRLDGKVFASSFLLWFTWQPPAGMMGIWRRMLFQGRSIRGLGEESPEGRFDGLMARLEHGLSSSLHPERKRGEKLLFYLRRSVMMDWDQRVEIPEQGQLASLFGATFRAGHEPALDRDEVLVASFQMWPKETYLGIAEMLHEAPFPGRFVVRFVPFDEAAGQEASGRRQGAFRQARINPREWVRPVRSTKERTSVEEEEQLAFESLGARELMLEMAKVGRESLSSDRRLGLLSVLFISKGSREELEERLQFLRRACDEVGIAMADETVGATEGYLGSLPGEWTRFVRRSLLSSAHVVNLIAATAPPRGSRLSTHTMLPEGAQALASVLIHGTKSVAHLNLHHGGRGHTMIFGPSGSGKSVALGFLGSQWLERYWSFGARVLVFDYDKSQRLFVGALEGRYTNVSPKTDGFRLQPLRHLDDAEEALWAEDWLLGVLALAQGGEPTSDQRQMISDAVSMLKPEEPARRTLSKFVDFLGSEELRKQYRIFLKDGPLGELLDGGGEEGLGLGEGRIDAFDLTAVSGLDWRLAGPIVTYLLRWVERAFSEAGPTLFVIDEAWHTLAHPVWREKLKRWLVTVRKRNVAVVMATQSPQQVLELEGGAELLQMLRQQCATTIVCPDASAGGDGQTAYEAIGLNEQERTMIADPRQMKLPGSYYVRGGGGERMVIDFNLSQMELAFLSGPRGMDSEMIGKEVAQLEEEHGKSWPGEWLHRHFPRLEHREVEKAEVFGEQFQAAAGG